MDAMGSLGGSKFSSFPDGPLRCYIVLGCAPGNVYIKAP